MEFKFDINRLFRNEITKLDKHSFTAFTRRKIGSEFRGCNNEFSTAIDAMGQASAKAQGLHVVITDTSRMLHSEHHLYIMKDAQSNNGLGCIVGLLKVGHKKLFVHSSHGVQYEVSPLCVLDFYVHESRQRKGCGKKLFEYMLETENTKAEALAIDRPSKKFLAFLMKHYHLKAPIPQVNNFVVFEAFFHTEAAQKSNRQAVSKEFMPFHNLEGRGLLSGDHRKRSAFVADLSNNTHDDSFLKEVSLKRSESRESCFSTKFNAQFTEHNNFTGVDVSTRKASSQMDSQNRYSRHMAAATPLVSEPTQLGLRIPTDLPTETTPPIVRKRSGHSRQQFVSNNLTDGATEVQHHDNQLPLVNDRPSKYQPEVNTNWNPFGVSQPIGRFSAASRKYQNTRLW